MKFVSFASFLLLNWTDEVASYADLVIVGGLQFFKVIDEEMFAKVVKIEPAFGTLYEASKKWLERDGH